jgi:hypothetical protein
VFAHNLKGYTIKTPTFATPTILFIENGIEKAGFQGYLSPLMQKRRVPFWSSSNTCPK